MARLTRSKFLGMVKKRVSARTHMSLILTGVAFSGVAMSWLLLALDVTSLLVRYTVVTVLAYGVFLLLVRMVAGSIAGIAQPRVRSFEPGFDIPSFGGGSTSGGGGGGSVAHHASFGGGSSGGGGAGSSFTAGDDADFEVGGAGGSGGFSGGGGSSGGGLDVDGDAVLIVALILLVAAIFGSSLWVIYQAPPILAEAAFELLLAAGLVRSGKRGHWATSVLRSTWVPFVVVLAMVVAFGWAAGTWCPKADRIAGVVNQCILK